MLQTEVGFREAVERIQKSERGAFIDSKELGIAYARFTRMIIDWKSRAFEWS